MGDLVTPTVTCDQLDSVGEVCRRLLAEHTHPPGVVVLDGRRYLGWVGFEQLGRILAEGRGHIPMSAAPLVACPQVGADMTLAEALEIAAARPDGQLANPLVIEAVGHVAGIVGVRTLIRAASEANRRAPSHVAPLTGLPSRVKADRWLDDRIRAGDPAILLFIDLRDFDAYNRAYGFDMGDLMLRQLVELLQIRLVDEQGALFFAHLGEDRFMLAFRQDVMRSLQNVIHEFQSVHVQLFSPADQASGQFSYVDTTGREHTLPLTSIRAVYLPAVLQRVGDPRDVYELATQLRMRRVESTDAGGVIITDRRAEQAAQRKSA